MLSGGDIHSKFIHGLAGKREKPSVDTRQVFCQAAEGSQTQPGSERPYSSASLEELKDRLELTVRAEDYKVAAAIRDEIR